MSGIAGVVRFGGDASPSELNAMQRLMQARGPTRQATGFAGEAGFAHALLASTPEALAEQQPWRLPNSNVLMVADSRLDNRPQLLRTLGISRGPDDVGDCELLHAAWQRWGTDCPNRLRGDFAFALWNPDKRELFVARDPMGVRPFAFHFVPGRLFVFGSTADIVLAQGQVPSDLDEGRIADVLIGETEGIDQVCTLYRAIERLPPAHWMRVCSDRIEQCRYWNPDGGSRPSGLPRTEAGWIEAQREQLDRAVRLRLRSHRPVGAMLSGGLDSSSIVALAARAHDKLLPLPVFAGIDSGNPDCAETRHAREVAQHTSCSSTWVDLAAFERGPMTKPAWWDAGVEPFDGAMTMIAEIYRAASAQDVASLLDGTPADNLFVTGSRARELSRRGQLVLAWRAALEESAGARHSRFRAIKTFAGCFEPKVVNTLRTWGVDRKSYKEVLNRSQISSSLAARVGLWQRYRRHSQNISDSHEWHSSAEAMSSMSAPYITAAIERYNRVASLFGVEPRHPFADRDLIQFQAWMPMALRARDGHRKWVLRQAMAGHLPDSVCWRRDKSHLGWRFTKAQMRFIKTPMTGLEADMPSDWLRENRHETHAVPLAPDHVPSRPYPAIALRRWLNSRSVKPDDSGADGSKES